ncbi:MAG: lipopolysaccharide assembly protein LapB [Piscinibacter sp.]|uniref:lipopolysaccharide assembly protein LapB n=1 Tax=Piscinibacter sp. TaxID=1903157 RepID=UPI003D0A7B0D
MDFDLQWLLLGLPVAFALGWLASRFDLRQWKREQKDSPKAYYQGLNLLLNEQHDKAIDAFIEAVQHDPDTSDLHFALGNLFRRRGEYERAVRVHEHLLQRADLPASERERAQHALAQDFMKAGLFDRAQQAFEALEGTVFDTEARLALLALHERSREWRAAAEVAARLERSGSGSFASRIAHHWCELAAEADARQQPAEAEEALQRAREAAPQSPRPLIMAGQRARARGDHREAVQQWGTLMVAHPAAFNLVAADYAESAKALGEAEAALERLDALHRRTPSGDLLAAIGRLDPDAARQRARVLSHLQQQGSLSAAQTLLSAPDAKLDGSEAKALHDAVARAAKPLHRYRCAACAFEAQNYFWQCPGCLGWDTYPPLRQEDL